MVALKRGVGRVGAGWNILGVGRPGGIGGARACKDDGVGREWGRSREFGYGRCFLMSAITQ